jgi:hypothetical protein
VVVLLAGCGGEDAAPPDAADINRDNHAREAVYLQRVLGDDPVSESVSLRVDGTAAVRRGGGRGYWDVAIELSEADTRRALAHVRAAPLAALEGNTITPGGFGGNDNDRRYMLRRGETSVTVTESDVPRRMRPLIRDLNALIDGDLGRIVADDRHFSAAGVTGSDASDDDDAAPAYENSPATPVRGGAAPKPDRSLSCYGSGTRQPAGATRGVKAGPLTLETARPRRGVIHAPAVLEPGAVVTIAVERPAGLLYGGADDPERVVRLEGCSDTTAGGGASRFDGSIVTRGCTTVRVYTQTGVLRRRVGCG